MKASDVIKGKTEITIQDLPALLEAAMMAYKRGKAVAGENNA